MIPHKPFKECLHFNLRLEIIEYNGTYIYTYIVICIYVCIAYYFQIVFYLLVIFFDFLT